MTGLRTDSLEKIAAFLETFAQRMKEMCAMTPGSSTATAS